MIPSPPHIPPSHISPGHHAPESHHPVHHAPEPQPNPYKHEQTAFIWSACRNCGLIQTLPQPVHGHTRQCSRCHTPFGSGVAMPHAALAFAITTLMLFILAQFFPIMHMEIDGLRNSSHIMTGVSAMADEDFPLLGLLVLFVVLAAPLLRIVSMIWIMNVLHRHRKPRYLIHLFKLSEQLRHWAMLDVLLLGVIVASSKLRELANIAPGIGFWALAFAVLSMLALEASFDPRAIWDTLLPPHASPDPPDPRDHVSCHVCNMLQKEQPNAKRPRCKRCRTRIHYRRPSSLNNTWALVITGLILYIPAMSYPVLINTSLGQATPTTIMGGVRQLMTPQDWPLAVILFTASIIIPLAKLLGFIFLMISIQRGSEDYLVARTHLYRTIHFIGRWSNTDIFVGAVLTGLVTLGNIASVEPGEGASAFGAVVVITMLAAEFFDPRLIWDAARKNDVNSDHV